MSKKAKAKNMYSEHASMYILMGVHELLAHPYIIGAFTTRSEAEEYRETTGIGDWIEEAVVIKKII